MDNFELALAHVLKAEGGYVNNVNDLGGATNYGITRATLEAFRGKTVVAEDVKALTVAEASQIYRVRYWEPNNLGRIQHPVIALALFDQIVNRRAASVIRGLQILLGYTFGIKLNVDGVMGPKTIEAVNAVRPEKLLAALVVDAQRAYIEIVDRSPSQIVFLKGWLARTWRLATLV